MTGQKTKKTVCDKRGRHHWVKTNRPWILYCKGCKSITNTASGVASVEKVEVKERPAGSPAKDS